MVGQHSGPGGGTGPYSHTAGQCHTGIPTDATQAKTRCSGQIYGAALIDVYLDSTTQAYQLTPPKPRPGVQVRYMGDRQVRYGEGATEALG